MAKKKISPLQAGFWLSEQEKRYILVICAIFLLGLIARYYYLMHETEGVYAPPNAEQPEQNHE
ncbi:MAG TPA: hypothetical protein VLL07_05765 [Pontiella sp.]|nr:hypothetical protein [Pontiella sp.]